jgi:Ni,Fe-hydrogenase III small subunit
MARQGRAPSQHTATGALEAQGAETAIAQASARLRQQARKLFGRSLHIRHVDAGSCNACESEIKLLTSPYYDLHRLGLFFTPSPRHADLLLVTGPITRGMEEPLRRTYEAMPDPKLVVAVGACACDGGLFAAGPFTRGGLTDVLPVDAYIPGCPPSPLALIHGLLLAIDRASQKRHGGVWYAMPRATHDAGAHAGDARAAAGPEVGPVATPTSSALEEQP